MYVIFDPPHMLKLMRNLLQAYGELKSSTGTICSQFLEDLQNVQEDAGLLDGQQVDTVTHPFLKSKDEGELGCPDIKLSSSVAITLDALSESNHPKFIESKATVEFIMVRISI